MLTVEEISKKREEEGYYNKSAKDTTSMLSSTEEGNAKPFFSTEAFSKAFQREPERQAHYLEEIDMNAIKKRVNELKNIEDIEEMNKDWLEDSWIGDNERFSEMKKRDPVKVKPSKRTSETQYEDLIKGFNSLFGV